MSIHPPVEVVKCLLQTFDGSAIELFREFLKQHAQASKWIIASDFSLHNKDRPLDCFAFTVLPYYAWPDEIERDVTAALPKDLKKSKFLDVDAIRWLRDPSRFHIAITLNKEAALLWSGENDQALSRSREFVSVMLSTATANGSHPETIRRFKKLKQETQANGFNTRLLGEILLLAVWYAMFSTLLARERSCKMIGWFPDRDDMTNYCDHVWTDFAAGYAQVFAEEFGVDMTGIELPVGVPDRSKAKERMWFDYMIRAADWFAGAVAAWDRENNRIPGEHKKYAQMLEKVIADARNIVVLHMDLTETHMQARRIVPERCGLLMLAFIRVRNMWWRCKEWLKRLALAAWPSHPNRRP